MSDTMTSGLVTIKYIVANFRNYKGIDDRYNIKFKQWVIDCFSELGMDGMPTSIKNKWLTMSDNFTIDFPDDYIDYVVIGVPYGGRMWSFTKDEGIITTRSEECGDITLDANRGEGQNRGEPVKDAYGMPGGLNETYFVDDKKNRRFVFRGKQQSEVLLIYKTTGISLTGETLIPRQYVATIRAYLHFKWSEFTDQPENKQMKLEARYYYEKKKLRKKEYKITMDEIKDVFYSSLSQAETR
jgi:hypothetical protein